MSFINKAKNAIIKKVRSDRALQDDFLDKLAKRDLTDLTMDFASLTGFVFDFDCYGFYQNIKRNRYNFNRVADDTRVQLESDIYINANHVSSGSNGIKFIAAESPLENTVNEFWRMMFEKNIGQIIMLGKCKDEEIENFFQYFPNGCEKVIGNFNIQVLDYNEIIFRNEKNEAIIVERKFSVTDSVTNQEKEISHFLFQDWLENKLPIHSKPLLYLYQMVVSKTPKSEHILVHCLDGITRTGVFIGAYFMYELFMKNQLCSFRGAVIKLRKQRFDSVQSGPHYIFMCCLFIDLLLVKDHKLDKTKLMELKTQYYEMLEISLVPNVKPNFYRAISAP